MTFKPPQPGELNHCAVVEAFLVTGTDANGQPVGSWQAIATAYVKLEGLSGRIAESARQLFETASHNIYCRYNEKITRSCRFVIGTVRYPIGWIDTDGCSYMRCTVEESWPQAQP